VFELRFATTTYTPPRVVDVLTPLNGWQNIEGSFADGAWVFTVDEAVFGDEPGYFKFLLDDRFWMDDPYILIRPASGGAYHFDEETVRFPMSTITAPSVSLQPVLPTPPVVGASPPDPSVAATLPTISEGAIINRVVLLLTPFLTAGAAWLAGVIAHNVPGVTLDQTQIVSFMIAIVVVCLAGAWKWLQGWQQHELLVAWKLAAPLKPVISPAPTAPR
jgi:hypothetical protein